MEKKKYIRPELIIYQITPSEIICGSGGNNGYLNGSGGSFTDGNTIYGDAAQRRGGWDDYEGR